MKATNVVLGLLVVAGLSCSAVCAETTGDLKALAKSLAAMATSARRPSKSSVLALSRDVMGAIQSKHLGLMTAWRIRGRLDAVLQSANISVADVMNAGAQTKHIMDEAGVPKLDAAKISNDVQAVVQSARR
jgi:hypothetical protein